ncbi:MAG: hypothetical protein HGA67_04115 [Candidatus Yonathbacteria bacterium]|nr:hypothetical protein [Candidatus Yonathbacteria bacterium]
MSTCPLSKEDIIFNLTQGLGYEERSLALYGDLLSMWGEGNAPEEMHDKEVITRIVEDERRHIDIVKRLIVIVEEYYNAN